MLKLIIMFSLLFIRQHVVQHRRGAGTTAVSAAAAAAIIKQAISKNNGKDCYF